MEENHAIALCRWQTTFDQQALAVELQNFISQWSNTVLETELDQYFNQLCPLTQTWRIKILRLDLGDILLDELPVELPKRLRASLRENFDRLQAQQHVVESTDNHNLQILDQIESYREFVIWFLRHGSSPWWFKGNESAIQIFDHQLQQDSQATLDILNDLGRFEDVRKRIVWQFGEPRVRQIIHLLEPWRGDVICAFADNLFEVQDQKQLLTTDTSDFRKVTWLTILTTLLVERGTLSNTVAFMRANLWQISQHYRIEFSDLIEQMFQAVLDLELGGQVSFTFFTAVKTIHQQDVGHVKSRAPTMDPTLDYWTQFQSMLQGGVKQQKINQENFKINELFRALTQQDAKRMAQLLRLESGIRHVQLDALLDFSDPELVLIVRVLEPHDHHFILAHVQYVQSLLELQQWDKKLIWREILIFLLGKHGSSLDRRQVVQHTLAQIRKRHHFDELQLLDLFIHATAIPQSSQHRFELLAILQDLRRKIASKQVPADTTRLYREKMGHYLDTGKYESSGNDQIQRTQQAKFNPLLGISAKAMQDLVVQQLEAAEHAEVDDTLYSQRLIEVVGAAGFANLLEELEPEASGFCLSLISSLLQWQKQGLLPCLQGVDLALLLPAMLIQVLIDSYQTRRQEHSIFNLNDFWRGFTALLQRKSQVNIDVFHQQLKYCLDQQHWGGSPSIRVVFYPVMFDGLNNSINSWRLPLIQDTSVPEERHTQKHTLTTSSAPVATKIASIPWTSIQLFQALRSHLLPKGSSSGDVPQSLAELSLESLWLQLGAGQVIVDWLDQQPDKYHLFQLLSKQRHIRPVRDWLLTQLPAELNPPEDTVQHLSVLLQQRGNWQGTSTVLEHHLSEVFWSVCFDVRSQHVPIDELLTRMVLSACLRLNIQVSDCLDRFGQQNQDHQNQGLARTHYNFPETLHAYALATPSESNDLAHTAITSISWSPIQLLQALRLYLLPQDSRLSDVPQSLAELSLESLWLQLDGRAVAQWLDQQPDKYHLLQLLSKQRHIRPVRDWLLAKLPVALNPPEEVVQHLSSILLQGACWQGSSTVLEQHLTDVFWRVSFDVRSYQLSVSVFLARMLFNVCEGLNIRVSDFLDSLSQQTYILEQAHWRNAFHELSLHSTKESHTLVALEHFETVPTVRHHAKHEDQSQTNFQQDYLANYLNHPRVIEIASHLLQYGRPPSWLKSARPIDLTRLLFDMFTVRPDLLPVLLHDFQSQPAVMFRILNIVPFAWLLDAIYATSPNKKTNSMWLEDFYQCLTHMALTEVSRSQRTAILFQLVLQHWLNRQWVELEVENLVSSFLWQIIRRYQVKKSKLQQAFEPQMDKLPKILKHALTNSISDAVDSVPEKRKEEQALTKTMPDDKKMMAAIKAAQRPHTSTTPMAINNIGLVLLQSFLTHFFSKLGLIQDNKFVTPNAQRRAVHYLQFLVTGHQETPEQFLMLNKLLCGLAPYEPVEVGIELSNAEKEICHSLLVAVITYWSAIGSSSIDGFRGNWLVRNGSLSDANDHWHLIVEKRAYDLLLIKAPFSYSVIKLPWMEKAIYVTWPI